MKYYANFSANNGTSLMHDITDTNKNRLLSRIRDIAMSERFEGNQASWGVYTKDESGEYRSVVEESYIPHVGYRYTFKNGREL